MLIFFLVFLLVSNAVTIRRDKSILFSRTVIISLIYTSFLTFNLLYLNPLYKGIGIFGGLFNVSTLTQTFNIFILLISAIILTLSAFYYKELNVSDHNEVPKKAEFIHNGSVIGEHSEQYSIIEYSLVIIFIITGAVFLMSTADLVSIFLAIELQSYGLYILSTIYKDSESSTASGLTYFLLGGMSSCFILFGSAILYANSGTTNLDNIYLINSITNTQENSWLVTPLYESSYIQLALIIMAVGFLFKVSAAPFHFWSPDVYDGIPTIVTTYVAIVPKISIFIFFLELVYYTESFSFDLSFSWKNILLLSSLLSLIVGSVLGLTQFRIKRLFAYSTISHVGFILLSLSICSIESVQAYMFYILQYSISNLNAFIMLVAIGYSLQGYLYNDGKKELVDAVNSPIQLISQIKGYFYINHFLAISWAITLFSFVGIPPLIGFFAKQMVLSAALDSGYVFMSLVAVITSVIGASYYLNLIKEIFFFKHNYRNNNNVNFVKVGIVTQGKTNNVTKIHYPIDEISLSTGLSSIISILTLIILLFIYIPEEWFNIVSVLSLILFKS